jgi:hypothetical protein
MQTRQALLSGGASTLIAPASFSTETSHQSPFIATILTLFCRSMQRYNLVDAVPRFVEAISLVGGSPFETFAEAEKACEAVLEHLIR